MKCIKLHDRIIRVKDKVAFSLVARGMAILVPKKLWKASGRQ